MEGSPSKETEFHSLYTIVSANPIQRFPPKNINFFEVFLLYPPKLKDKDESRL